MRFIPNENSWVGFVALADGPADLDAPTETELAAATTLTKYFVSVNASASGNVLPAPSLDSLFDRSVIGTSQGQFQAECYRDDEVDPDYVPSTVDLAWSLFPRATAGYLYISRFGGTGTDHMPVAGQAVEVWPIRVSSRVAGQMQSNTIQTFTIQGAVFDPPGEDAIVASGTSVPSAPRNLEALAGAAGIVNLDWEVPAFTGASAITGYKVYKSTVAGGGGAYTEVTTNIVKAGTTATLSSLTAGLTYFKVAATNTQGDSVQSAFASATVAA